MRIDITRHLTISFWKNEWATSIGTFRAPGVFRLYLPWGTLQVSWSA